MPSRLSFAPSRITLGSAQFGLPYGIANSAGQPSERDVFAILDHAFDAGITTIDTARAYGSSELRIGHWLAARRPASAHIVTKVPALPKAPSDERRGAVNRHLAASMKALGTEPLALVLVHEETDLLDPHIVNALQSAVAQRRIGGFGASAYRPDVAAQLIETLPIAALQVPASIVDRQFERAGIFAAAAARGIAVFARSIFLQGALLARPDLLPAHLAPLSRLVEHLHLIAWETERSLAEILIPPMRDIPGVTSLVLGIDRADQLAPHLLAMGAASLPASILQQVQQAVGALPPGIIDPSNWKTLAGRDIAPS